MSDYLSDGAVIVFEPVGPWKWSGWDGRGKLSVADHKFRVAGKPLALASDIESLFAQLIGQAYTATGFSDVPGAITMAKVTVTSATLSEKSAIGGKKLAVAATTGEFSVQCIPSLKAASPPVPDPLLMKTGRWKVESTNQSKARST
ncbi:MAG: hypothetical protein JNK57_15770 [Planctomycetaceae bacterium]|jgi:hypothetical protein|nr:hypothetical protein [Planctomycetaceae bacterium]